MADRWKPTGVYDLDLAREFLEPMIFTREELGYGVVQLRGTLQVNLTFKVDGFPVVSSTAEHPDKHEAHRLAAEGLAVKLRSLFSALQSVLQRNGEATQG